ncbi:hypothetical protein [Xenophilus sp.]|uniref:head-tail joining protein n=1 Tax=Xenophilus sp. TaxID=1873499 RepID=UPI0037DD385B
MGLVEQVYAAAANAGLLRDCHWQPADGSPVQTYTVGFSAPDDTLFDGLASATDYQMSYPASAFVGLAVRDAVDIGGMIYQVRDIRAVGDGSEMRAKLTRL